MSVSLSAIPTYLSIIKDEPVQADKFAQSDPTTRNTLAQANKQAPRITSPVGLLDNYAALQVVLGAEGMSDKISQTGLLKQLLTQDPNASGSLVQRLASVTDLHFANAMHNQNTLNIALGNPSNLAFATGGSSAATITLQSANYDTGPATQTAGNVAQQWNYVLNDGTAGATIAAALAKAAGGTASYGVSGAGVVTASPGAPAVTSTRNSDGSTTYAIAAARDAAGKTTRQIDIVSVPVTAGATGAAGQLKALVSAMNSTGFAVVNNKGTLSINSPTGIDTTGLPSLITTASAAFPAGSTGIALGAAATGLTAGMMIRHGSTVIGQVSSVDSAGNVTLTGASQAAIAAGDQLTVSKGISASVFATPTTMQSSTVLALGSAMSGVNAGQNIYDNGKLVGTISSIDGSGNVTLTAAAATMISSGDRLTVAAGASISGVTQSLTTTGAVAAGQTRLSLGTGGTALQPGQVLSLGSVKVGTVKSVDGNGNVTLTGATTTAISQGATLTASASLSQTTTPALSDAANLANIEKRYSITQYEANEGQQVPGLDTALYVTRIASSITDMNELMSDANMLKVVSSDLGYDWNTFGSMSYDRQVGVLTKGAKLTDFQDPKKVQAMCERYLTLNGGSSGSSNPLLSLFGGGGGGGSANAILSALGAGSGGSDSSNPTLALFA